MTEPVQTIAPTADDQIGTLYQRPDSGYQDQVNIILYVDELGQNRWRVDGRGSMGCQSIHVAAGTNMPASEAATIEQAVWIDPVIDVPLVRADSPTTLESASWTSNYIEVRDKRTGAADMRFRVDKGGRVGIRSNAGPADADVKVGECVLWFDPTPGTMALKIKGKDSLGNTKIKTILL